MNKNGYLSFNLTTCLTSTTTLCINFSFHSGIGALLGLPPLHLQLKSVFRWATNRLCNKAINSPLIHVMRNTGLLEDIKIYRNLELTFIKSLQNGVFTIDRYNLNWSIYFALYSWWWIDKPITLPCGQLNIVI